MGRWKVYLVSVCVCVQPCCVRNACCQSSVEPISWYQVCYTCLSNCLLDCWVTRLLLSTNATGRAVNSKMDTHHMQLSAMSTACGLCRKLRSRVQVRVLKCHVMAGSLTSQLTLRWPRYVNNITVYMTIWDEIANLLFEMLFIIVLF